MNNKSRFIVASISILSGVALLSGQVHAAWAVTDNANSFGVQISVGGMSHQVSFHTPNSGDSTCMSYNTTNEDADYGQTLNDITVPSTASFLGFDFGGWYTDNAFTQAFSNSTPITSDIDLYAKYTRSNVLYDGTSTYFVSSNIDQTVDSQYVYKIATQTWGITPTKNESDKVDLISESGIYKMTYASSTWTILRKVGVSAKDVWWWGNDSYITYAYGQPEDRNTSYDDIYWGGLLSTNYATVTSSQTGVVYIDYSIPYIGVGRYSSDKTTISGYIDDSKRPTDYTDHISLDSGYKYTKDSIYLYINPNKDGRNKGHLASWGSL